MTAIAALIDSVPEAALATIDWDDAANSIAVHGSFLQISMMRGTPPLPVMIPVEAAPAHAVPRQPLIPATAPAELTVEQKRQTLERTFALILDETDAHHLHDQLFLFLNQIAAVIGVPVPVAWPQPPDDPSRTDVPDVFRDAMDEDSHQ